MIRHGLGLIRKLLAFSKTADFSSELMKRWLVILLLCQASWAAISFHAAGTTVRQNGGSLVLTLPTVSNNDLVLCGVSALQNTWGNTPSGWSVVFSIGNFAVFDEVWTTGASTSVTIVGTGSVSWETGVCISYSGVNTSTPIDMSNTAITFNVTNSFSPNSWAGPPVFPTNTADMNILFCTDTSQFGSTISTSSGMTSRINFTAGPSVAFQELALSNANPTSPELVTFGSNQNHYCAQIVLLPASGGSSATQQVQPTIAGLEIDATEFTELQAINGDLVAVYLFGTGNSASCAVTTTGYTNVYSANDMTLYTHKWLTGDTTTLTTSNCSAANENIVLIRNATGGASPQIDPASSSGGTTTASSTTTVNCPSIAMTTTNELLVCQYSAGNSGTPVNGSWTIPGGLSYLMNLNSSNRTAGMGVLQGPSNPSGTFTGTDSVSGTQNAGASAFCIVCTATSRGFPAVY